MNRRLIILRHGAAMAARIGTSDRDRPLEERGRAQCLEVASELERLAWVPELALVSPARRTRESWAAVAEYLPDTIIVQEHPTLYGGGWDVVRFALGVVDPAERTVIIVAHNPGVEDVVLEATGFSVALGTGHAVLLAGTGRSWSVALRAGHWELVARIVPLA